MRNLSSPTLAMLVACGLLTACESAPFDASCAGSAVELFGPHEYALVGEASVEPPMLPIADFAVNAMVRVEVERCPDAPAPHEIELAVLVPDEDPSPDGGVPVRVMSLVTLRDGEDGDTPGDGRVEVEIPNPFIATVPENTDVTLRFTVKSTTPAGCTSGFVEIPYRTGPRRMM